MTFQIGTITVLRLPCRRMRSFEALLCLAAASTLPLTIHLASHIGGIRGSSARRTTRPGRTASSPATTTDSAAAGLKDVPRLSARLESAFAAEWGGAELSHHVLEEGLLPLAPRQHPQLAPRLRRALAARIASCVASAQPRSASSSTACTLRLVFVGSALTAGRVSEEVHGRRASAGRTRTENPMPNPNLTT